MNIFTTSDNPIQCAVNLDDKRVKHMLKECIELISIALFLNTKQVYAPLIIWDIDRRSKGEKIIELFNNRCTVWTASKRENLWWLYNHTLALFDEYEYRFNTIHYLKASLMQIQHWIPRSNQVPSNWPNASGFVEKDVFESYKKCLVYKWFGTDKVQPIIWTNRETPNWIDKYRGDVYTGDLFGYNPGQLKIEDIYDDLPF